MHTWIQRWDRIWIPPWKIKSSISFYRNLHLDPQPRKKFTPLENDGIHLKSWKTIVFIEINLLTSTVKHLILSCQSVFSVSLAWTPTDDSWISLWNFWLVCLLFYLPFQHYPLPATSFGKVILFLVWVIWHTKLLSPLHPLLAGIYKYLQLLYLCGRGFLNYEE